MRATLLVGALVLMAACAGEAPYQDPAPTGGSSTYAPPQPDPCDRADFPAGAAGDTDYTNCVIQS